MGNSPNLTIYPCRCCLVVIKQQVWVMIILILMTGNFIQGIYGGADELTKLKAVITDPISTKYCQNFLELMIEEANVNDVASALNKCVTQACDRICRKSSAGQIRKKGNRKNPWYDGECHFKRAAAVHAGQRASLKGDSVVTLNACREYRACKQNKERSYKWNAPKKYNMHTCMTGRVCGQLLIN